MYRKEALLSGPLFHRSPPSTKDGLSQLSRHYYKMSVLARTHTRILELKSFQESFFFWVLMLQCLSFAIKLHWWWWERMKKTLTTHKMAHKNQGSLLELPCRLSADEKASGEAEPCFMTSLGCNGAVADTDEEDEEDFFLLVDTGGRYITLSSLRSIEADAPGG